MLNVSFKMMEFVLDQIHGIDETKVFTGIRTDAGYQLYERFVKEQSKDNKVKVAPKKIAVAWNAEVDRLIVAADSDSVRYVQMCTWIIHTILTYLNRPCPAAP